MSIVIRNDTDADPSLSDQRLDPPWRRNSLISGGVLLPCVVLARWPDVIDRPVSRWMDSEVGRSRIVDHLFVAFDTYFTFSGTVLMALIWACWSAADGVDRRARIVVGVLVAFGAGIVSRFLQHTFASHLRPIYDPAVAFQIPDGFDNTPLNAWNSFPSDHATVFAGLVVVLFTVRSKLAVPAALWTTLVESARLYVGVHFPTDLFGGAALAATCVWASQAHPSVDVGRRIVALERSAPALFHGTAFFISFQIATLFNDIRGLASRLHVLGKLHGW